jgi:hypothetical protein
MLTGSGLSEDALIEFSRKVQSGGRSVSSRS